LLAHARAILREPGAAEDAVQAVMCRLLELPRARLAAVEDVAAFLVASVRREAMNQIRSARRERIRREASQGRRGARHHAAAPTGEPAAQAQTALDLLPRRLREVVVLRHACGLTFDQIALALAANRNTVATRYRAAVRALKDLLTPVEGAAHG
jgi:RNA polymerase sigma factor (sigma-70 family)